MRVEPNFTGRVQIVSISECSRAYHDCKTAKQIDDKVLKLADKIFAYGCFENGEPILKKDGNKLVTLVKKSTGDKINLSKNCEYTYKRDVIYNPGNENATNHIRLLGVENNRNTDVSAKTGIDIWI